jgi:hypothetical protein
MSLLLEELKKTSSCEEQKYEETTQQHTNSDGRVVTASDSGGSLTINDL